MLRVAKILVLGCALTILFAGCEYRTPLEVQKDLRTSLPVGTSKKDVIAFLDRNEYEHSGRYKPELYYDKNKQITAVAPGKKFGILVSARVYVTFQFNKDDELVDIETEEVKTGL